MTESRRADLESRLESLSLAQIRALRQESSNQRKRRRLPPLVREERLGTLPLSYAQERLWFLDQLGLVGPAYNVQMVLRIEGNLIVEILQRSFDEIIRRHESLRTRFESTEGSPVQIVDPDLALEVKTRDLTLLPDTDKSLHVQQLSREEMRLPFDLSKGPLLRVSLLKSGTQKYVLLITMHHIITDGWSWDVFHRELHALYGAYSESSPSPLPQIPIQYADYAIWQRRWLQGDVLEEQLTYWKQRLRGVPPQLQLPTDRARPAAETFHGAEFKFTLPKILFGVLKELGHHEGATLFMVSLAAFQVLLSRWSGQQDIVVGSPIAGRTSAQLEGIIGFFVNTLVLRADCSGNPTFREFLRQVKERTLEAYAHQDLPFGTLVKELRPERDLTRQPIVQVMVSLLSDPEERLEVSGLTWAWSAAEGATTFFDLTLYLYESSHGLSGTFEYATDLFERTTIERMAASLGVLFEAIVENPDRPIQQLPILSEADKRKLLYGWNDTARAYPCEKLIHELIEEQVVRTPEAIAVVYEGQSVTYGEMNARANQLARSLRGKGVGPDRFVGLCVERGIDMVVGLLGILKAGGAYVPLDSSYPLDRLGYMLVDSAPIVVLSHARLRDRLPVGTLAIAIDERWPEIAQQPVTNIGREVHGATSKNLAYAIYTSGSTGRPKGVAIEHRNAVNLIWWARSVMPSGAFNRTLLSTSLNFDLSVYECFVPLCVGGSVEVVKNVLEVLSGSAGITLINTVPSAIKGILDAGSVPPSVRVVNLAGEVLRKELGDRIFRDSQVGMLCNLYGPSETTTYSTWIPMSREEGFVEGIGRPIANTRIYILDNFMSMVPIGVIGEVYIAGAGVARGYLNRPDQTAKSFLQDPFASDSGARMYKTGDLARWRGDGAIEYLGRNDHQVKIRGFRIELGEIEAVLADTGQIKDAVVIAREDVPGQKRLVAYLVAEGLELGTNVLDVDSLRENLKKLLPAYMVPNDIVMLDRMPLTANGKVDRHALPAPENLNRELHHYVAPSGDLEHALAEIWAEVLHVDRIGANDNFFDRGGHSLLATQLVSRIQSSLALEIPVRFIFDWPTVRQLALKVGELRKARLLHEIEHGAEGMQELLDRVTAMPESEVQELVRQLTSRGRHV